jgi:hypothetical protein
MLLPDKHHHAGMASPGWRPSGPGSPGDGRRPAAAALAAGILGQAGMVAVRVARRRAVRGGAAQPEGNRNAGLFWAANRALDTVAAA